MSSYNELKWRDEDYEKYSTDKLYFIWNILKQPFPPQYREMVGELAFRKEKKQREENLKRIKEIVSRRDDKGEIREAWKKLHPNKEIKKDGKYINELAKLMPNMAGQLGAFIELENIEIKYFDENGEPLYELTDFKDIFPKNFAHSGFRKYGLTKEQFLKIYPNIDKENFERLLSQVDLEQAEDDSTIIPYYPAIQIKQILVDQLNN